MIEKRKGKYKGYCDICGNTTPTFNSWEECRQFMRENWKQRRVNGEWEQYCEDCVRIMKVRKIK
jgi:ribosomal protein S14